ncbi:MAG: hypothetical protein Q9187_008768 [Circinaria calcarea]
MSQAHAEDFERKRRPGTFAKEDDVSAIQESPGSSDEDEDEGVDGENEQDVLDAAVIVDRHRGHIEDPSVPDTNCASRIDAHLGPIISDPDDDMQNIVRWL